MKKIFTLTALAAAMIAAATSCQKEELVNQNDGQQAQNQGLVFYATLENTDAKTTITNEDAAGYKISWEATDSISVNGTVYLAVPDGENPAKATFVKKRSGDPEPEAPYKAYYPASIYDGTAATLPATQAYQADGSIAAVLPMYASNETENTFNFTNLCGLMKFTLKGTQKLQGITITDESKALSGKFTVKDNAAVLDAAAEGGVSLDCGAEGVQLDETTGKTFYVAIPAGSYSCLHIKYNTANEAYKGIKANGTAEIERNKVYPFSLSPKPDWFYFEAVEAGATIGMSATGSAPSVSLQYSTDGGKNWADFTVGSTSVALADIGDRVYFKAGTNANERFSSGDGTYLSFTTTKNVNVGGNIMYLLNGNSPVLSFSKTYGFNALFNKAKIVSASELNLPATTLKGYCYQRMFRDCTALVNAPALPATTLANLCYSSMFDGCTALVNAPALPATTLKSRCYSGMFNNCSSLVNAPALPATTLATVCYSNMFYNCTALVNAPVLPATKLETGCYESMFNCCAKLPSVTMLATNVSAVSCLDTWLSSAGLSADSPILYVDPTMTGDATINKNKAAFTIQAYSGK